LIVYNATHNWWGVGRFADAFGKSAGVGARLSAFGRRFVLLWTEDLPAGLHFHASSLATVKAVSYFYYAVTLALAALLIVLTRSRLRTMAVALWPRARRAAADADFWLLAPVAYVALYALVYSYSDYGLFARQWGSMDPETHCHIFALYPPLLLIGGLAVGRAWTTKWRWAGAAAVVALVLGGGFGYAQMLSFSRPESGRLSRAAYDLNVIYMEIGSKWGADPQQVQRLERQLSGPPLRAFLFGVGIKYGLDHAKSLAVALDECAVQPDHLLPYCWFGIGTGLYAGSTLPPEQLDAVLGNAPERVRPWLVLGSCVGSIWTGHAEYHTCQDAARIYVPAIAPPPEARALQVFVWGHLVMGQFRPAKQ
jgi:hypothetical protein